MLKVEHVSYRYPNGERDVLQDVCCTLEDGQLSAIVENHATVHSGRSGQPG